MTEHDQPPAPAGGGVKPLAIALGWSVLFGLIAVGFALSVTFLVGLGVAGSVGVAGEWLGAIAFPCDAGTLPDVEVPHVAT